MNGESGNFSDVPEGATDRSRKCHRADRPLSLPLARNSTIAISRHRGARGSQVADELGRRLGWKVYDRSLIDEIASDSQVESELVEGIDERHTSWIVECLEAFMGAPTMSRPAYVHGPVKVLLSLAARDECIIVGRGAGFLLPPASTLRVGLVAPLKQRIKWIAGESQLTDDETARQIKQLDRVRQLFVKDNFHKDPRDVEFYDLILNTGRFSDAQCVEFISEGLAVAQAKKDAKRSDSLAS